MVARTGDSLEGGVDPGGVECCAAASHAGESQVERDIAAVRRHLSGWYLLSADDSPEGGPRWNPDILAGWTGIKRVNRGVQWRVRTGQVSFRFRWYLLASASTWRLRARVKSASTRSADPLVNVSDIRRFWKAQLMSATMRLPR